MGMSKRRRALGVYGRRPSSMKTDPESCVMQLKILKKREVPWMTTFFEAVGGHGCSNISLGSVT